MGIKYIEPATGKNSFTCPHCGVISLMHFHCISYIDKKVIGFQEDKHAGNSWVQVATCHNCAKHIVWVDNIYAYPDIVAEEANPDMPEEVKQLYNEAGLIYNKSPRAACALLRLAIDRLCNELGETDRDKNDNQGVLQSDPEDFIVDQRLVVLQANEHIFLTHGSVKERGVDAHKHGIDNEHGKEYQEGCQEQVGCHRFPHHQLPGTVAYGNCFVCQGYPPLKVSESAGRVRAHSHRTKVTGGGKPPPYEKPFLSSLHKCPSPRKGRGIFRSGCQYSG